MYKPHVASLWVWGPLAVVALLWPARTAAALDGIPLETVPKAIVIGVVFPSLFWFHARFLRTRMARGAIVALLAWKVFGVVALVPDGWCVRFEPGRPLVDNATGVAPHSWDVRADWRAGEPACSAVMRRPYNGLGEFPAWFFNLPPPGESFPIASDRPPGARTTMTVVGFLHAPQAGSLEIAFGPDMVATTFVDGVARRGAADLTSGIHRIRIDALLTGDYWRFVPRWNGADLWRTTTATTATLTRPSRLDLLVRPAGGWLVTALVAALMTAWIVSFCARFESWLSLAWMFGASACLATLVMAHQMDAARWSVAGLAGASLLPLPPRLRNIRGAFALVGVPWLALIVVTYSGEIGRFTLYGVGNDYWLFQRAAYRIVMQGYWLEGGSRTFYFQPFYRWIAGIIHLVFGDSSVGERYWDAACLLVTALFAFYVVKTSVGFRWGLAAAAISLAIVSVGTPWSLIGQGLGENSSAGFLYGAAFLVLRGRRGSLALAVVAGAVATLAFYTRLNNLPMACGAAVFALSLRVPIRELLHARTRQHRIAWRPLVIVPVVLAIGLMCFAWRTWYYTGVFSVFHGTQRYTRALAQPGVPLHSVVGRSLESAMMVLTVNDPPRFDVRALPVLAGAAAAVLAVLGIPRFRDLPAAPVLFFLTGISAAFVARGSAYPGRFSVHVIAITCALTACAAARLSQTVGRPS